MGDRTRIEWTDATWNPTRGCSRVSPGCTNCYAERMARRHAGKNGAYEGLIHSTGAWNGGITLVEGALDTPVRWRKPRRVFVDSMSDLFHERVPFEFIDKVFEVMVTTPHTYQVLTKRPHRMLEYMREERWPRRVRGDVPPDNVWLGVSVEDQERAAERIPLLLETPAAVRFLSCEPLLGPIDLRRLRKSAHLSVGPCGRPLARIDWVIVGGESGPGARPMHPRWARSIRDQCVNAGAAFFFKQWGEWVETAAQAGGDLGGDVRAGRVRLVEMDRREPDGVVRKGDVFARRVGKKFAGRMLDGRTWDEFPT